MATFLLDPDATLDYQVDWSAWLDDDTISSHTVTGSGVTIGGSAESGGVVTFWVSGGTVGTRGTATVEIVTTEGRTDQRTVTFVCVER